MSSGSKTIESYGKNDLKEYSKKGLEISTFISAAVHYNLVDSIAWFIQEIWT